MVSIATVLFLAWPLSNSAHPASVDESYCDPFLLKIAFQYQIQKGGFFFKEKKHTSIAMFGDNDAILIHGFSLPYNEAVAKGNKLS